MMQIWEKLPSDTLPKASYDTIQVTTIESGLTITCIPIASKGPGAEIIFPSGSLIAFEWSDDLFDALRKDGVQEPRPIIGNGIAEAYPFLEVKNSPWLERRKEVASSFPNVRHFRFISESVVVDVLAQTVPKIKRTDR